MVRNRCSKLELAGGTGIERQADAIIRAEGAAPQSLSGVRNIFMGMSDTLVEFRIYGAEWKAMLRVETLDPTIVEKNIEDARSEELGSYDLMSEATPSQHLWRAAVATDLSLGKHQIEVRAKLNDQWFVDSLEYRLQEANP